MIVRAQRIEAEQARRFRLVERLKRCVIRAPADGMAIHAGRTGRRTQNVVLKPGTIVRERQLLLQLPDLNHLRVRARIDSSRAKDFKKGQSVKLRFDAIADPFSGTVIGTAQSPDSRNQHILLVAIDEPTALVKIGLTCVVETNEPKGR